MNRISLALVIAVAALVVVAGCSPKSKPSHASTQPNPVSPVMDDVAQRMTELQKLASELSTIVKNLPGRDTTEDRTLTADAFDRAAAAVTLLGGPEPGGALRQQLRIIDNVRQHLRSSVVDMSYDPNVDTGLRSLQNALVNVRERLFPNDAAIQKQLDALRDSVDALDAVRGPLHAVAAAHAFSSASAVIDTMSAQLEGRAVATQP